MFGRPSTSFGKNKKTTTVVNSIDFSLYENEILAIVGESGSGKSVTSKAIMGLLSDKNTHIKGRIEFEQTSLLSIGPKEFAGLRGNDIAMIFQEPMSALNPSLTCGFQVAEILLHHNKVTASQVKKEVLQLFEKVKLPRPQDIYTSYPHQISGGQMQRVIIAMAIACKPKILIADEPTTSLDVTIQAAYLRLLREIQAESGLGIIFITHDFGIVANMCDRVGVMYAGRLVETGDVRDIFNHPQHPYTQALISSVPKLEEKTARLYSIEGQPPALYDLPSGCSFAPRCPYVMDICREEFPPEFDQGGNQRAACWKLDGGKRLEDAVPEATGAGAGV